MSYNVKYYGFTSKSPVPFSGNSNASAGSGLTTFYATALHN